MAEPKQLCSILRVERIAEYLECAAGKVRTALTNIQDGAYCVEVQPGKSVRVISVPVERMAGMAWTPSIQQQEGK
jgi:hypothetical protein